MDPTTTAPAAAAPAAPAAAAPAAVFDSIAIEDPQPAPQPQMDPPLGQEPAAKPGEVAKPADAATTQEPKPGEPAKPDAAAAAAPATPAKMWAERFKTPEELEVAYGHSSKEGQRLAALVKELNSAQDKAATRIQQLELEKQIGPEMKELTDEQAANMSPKQISDYNVKMLEAKLRKEQLEKEQKLAKTSYETEIRQREEGIIALGRSMAKDAANFPDYETLLPLMDELMDLENGIVGHPNTPKILYFAAFGKRALAASVGAKAAADKAAKDAAEKAAADVARGGGPGPTAAEKTPAGEKTAPAQGSDEEHNTNLVKAWQRQHGGVFPG